MKKFVAAACAVGQVACLTGVLSLGFAVAAQADECAKNPRTARERCLKATFNNCNHGNGKWEHPERWTNPAKAKDACLKK